MMTEHPILSSLPYHANFVSFQKALSSVAPSPKEIRAHSAIYRRDFLLDKIHDWHYFGIDQYNVADTIQRLIISRYQAIDFESPADVRSFYAPGFGPPLVAAVIGIAGVGKTETIGRCLTQYEQIVEVTHSHFVNKIPVVVWFSHSIQSTEKKPFAQELARAWNALFERRFPELPPPIPKDIIEKATGDRILDEFEISAKKHYLGLLHVDEFNNLFSQLSSAAKKNSSLNVSVVDDKTLRKLLAILNSRSFATLISGTPEGAEGFSRRLSTAQRIGFRQVNLKPFRPDELFVHFLNELWVYQYTDKPIPLDKKIIDLFYLNTAGIQRLVLAGFQIAQENVLRMGKQSLSYEDFRDAFDSFSHELKMINRAIINNDETILAMKADFRSRF